VPVVPDVHGGIEYPGEIYLGSHQLDATPSHEVGHEWFYGLVGDDQARDPWLDESFATYVEAIHRGNENYYAGATIPSAGRNRVGQPMTYWEKYGENTYFRSVYLQGATALLNARTAAGAAAFDRAIRCYVNSAAHRVARPGDLVAALRRLPAALGVLRKAGALG
jgi:aminopeptidase N